MGNREIHVFTGLRNVITFGFAALICLAGHAAESVPWPLHTIDNSAQGADGVRFTDVNGDGLPDCATPFEEGGVTRVYLHPGPGAVRDPWPSVTVGRKASPEDAVLADLDGDGAADVVTSCEGDTRAVIVHWAPSDPDSYLDESKWETARFSMLPPVQWMYAAPADIDGVRGIDIIVGGKNKDAVLGWLASPENPRDLDAWEWHPLQKVGWVMSIVPIDQNGDGNVDILVSDRRGDTRGYFRLMHPGVASLGQPWERTGDWGGHAEVMFLDRRVEEGNEWIACATTDAGILISRTDRKTVTIPWPQEGGTGKSAALGDIDLDGNLDLVVSAEHADDAFGVQWTPLATASGGISWHPISTHEGIKYDALRLVDLDGDGDLDVATCEERTNLGVIWYENPTVTPPKEGS